MLIRDADTMRASSALGLVTARIEVDRRAAAIDASEAGTAWPG
jgi:hypothetical protein